MKKLSFLYLLIVLMLPTMAAAQDSTAVEVDVDSLAAVDTMAVEADGVDSLIDEMAAQCPVDYGDDWMISSVTVDGDTVFVDVQVPSQLKAFMSSLTGNGANVKRLWLNQIAQFDKRWRTLADKLLENNRVLVLLLIPGDEDEAAPIVIGPKDPVKV